MNRFVVAAIAIVLCSTNAAANDLSYSYVEGGVVWIDPDGLDAEAGFGIAGQAAVADQVFIWGAFSSVDFDSPIPNVEVDVEAVAIGGGYFHPVSENTDFVGRLGLGQVEVGNFDDDGFVGSLAFRTQWTPDRAESTVGVSYDDIGDGEASVFVEGVYQFNETVGLAAALDFAEDGNSAFLGIRASF